MTLWTVANYDVYAVLCRPDGTAAARFHVIAEAYMACEAINAVGRHHHPGGQAMSSIETMAQKAAEVLRNLAEAIEEGAGPLAADCESLITALAAANAQLERERDALLDEWREIAAGLTTDEPEIGALWPMVAEVSGSLSAVRLHFKNEVVAHNATKAQRDAANAERVAAEAVVAAARCIKHWHDAMADGSGMVVSAEHVRALWAAIESYDAALTPTPEAPKDGE